MAAQYKLTVAELQATKLQEIETKGSLVTISVANVTDISAGILTFRFSQEDSAILETPDINTIDLAAPTSFTVEQSALGGVEIILTAYAGTPTDITIVVNDRD